MGTDSEGSGPTPAAASDNSTASTRRPFYPKRSHRKSRAGCRSCKARKVKCDEARPRCRACVMRQEACEYPRAVVVEVRDGSPVLRPRTEAEVAEADQEIGARVPLTRQPMWTAGGDYSATDMRLLWHYTACGYQTFAEGVSHGSPFDETLQIMVPRHALGSRFLMDCLLGLSAVELQQRGDAEMTAARVLAYRARAFSSYRQAIQAAHPETHAPLLAGALLLCALSSQMFRDAGAKPLCLLDWMGMWRGIGLVINLTRPAALVHTGMRSLFARPPVDLDAAASHVPNALLFMATTLRPGEPDFKYAAVYYTTLQFLGSLFLELRTGGASPVLAMRVITWFTFIPGIFVSISRALQPRALIILAHYLVFVRLCRQPWWLQGIAAKEIHDIAHALEDRSEWNDLLRMPLEAAETEDPLVIAKLLLNDHSWKPSQSGALPAQTDLTIVDNSGHIVEFNDGWFQVDTGRPAVWNMHGAKALDAAIELD